MRMKAWRGVLMVFAVAFALSLAGCGSIAKSSPASAAPLFKNGQVVDIEGRVVMDKNQVTLQDLKTQTVFRFTGLQAAPQKALSGLAGKVTRVRLRVVSAQAARVYNAQFIQFSTR
jgi:hypothetical protein